MTTAEQNRAGCPFYILLHFALAMSFSMQFRPRPSFHYVLTALIGMDGELYWFTWELSRILNMQSPAYTCKVMTHSVQVKHIAGSLTNTPPRFMERYVINHDLFLQYLSTCPDVFIREFGSKICDPQTRVRVLLEKEPDNFDIPTQLLICDDGLDRFAGWYEMFKINAITTLYTDPLPNVGHLLNLLNDDDDNDAPTTLLMDFRASDALLAGWGLPPATRCVQHRPFAAVVGRVGRDVKYNRLNPTRNREEKMFELKLGEHKLLGIVGAGGFLYWSGQKVAKMVKYKSLFTLLTETSLKMKDVSLFPTADDSKIITHDTLLDLLKKSKLTIENHARLKSLNFPITVEKEGLPYPCATLCEKDTPGARLFKYWIDDYKMDLILAATQRLQQSLILYNHFGKDPIYVQPKQTQLRCLRSLMRPLSITGPPRKVPTSPPYPPPPRRPIQPTSPPMPPPPPPPQQLVQCVTPQPPTLRVRPQRTYVQYPTYVQPQALPTYSPPSPPYVPPPQPQAQPTYSPPSPPYVPPPQLSPQYEAPTYSPASTVPEPSTSPKASSSCSGPKERCKISVYIDSKIPTEVNIFNGNESQTYTCTG